ncbi:sulfotransferase family 2 domain-containing protein [Winogradskyella psychrotolerans]|uniref:sulfotransferase family 2 domain-containing protein n=1 Tax=Winogradskyella psychrotolerans TaxID=1344585 RepID=UPI001C0779CA|nr:sulfotransferase family 2 domain-containing protein [Winogradskyella psychrotolerans]MBU2927583.1 sulfotransferase family protein [Winogradskyella psychrotolerans]
MPYSKKLNTLFVHIPKCAGKSFEVAVGMISKSESQKYKWRSFFNRASKYMLTQTRDKNSLSRLWGTFDISIALQHLTYTEIELLGLLGQNTMENAIKVAIVRNSYDRAVSSYLHMGGDLSFKDFVKTYYTTEGRDHNDLAHKRTQLDYLRNKKGEIVVDNILRFENLNEDFKRFKDKYNLKVDEMPHIGKQRDKKKYQEFYCDESFAIVSEVFKEDIEYFNFKMDTTNLT